LARLKRTIDTMDEFVSKTESALTLEQALNKANHLQKSDVLARMASLVSQVETMHGKWKEEQEQRMKHQHAHYEKVDEARQLRLQMLDGNTKVR
jgi:hypothetical protein